LPLKVARIIQWESSHAIEVTPEPGNEHTIDLARAPGVMRGQLDLSAMMKLAPDSDPWLDARHTVIWVRPVEEGSEGTYGPLLSEDGSFIVDGLAPGEYDLDASLHAPPPGAACGRGTAVAHATRRVTIPAEGGVAADLGTIDFVPAKYPQPDAPLPAFAAENLDGSPWKTADLKGRYTLIDFWASWCAPCREAFPKVRSIHERFASRDDFTVVGMNLDFEKENAASSVAEEQLTWPQIYAGAWADDNPVTSLLGVAYIPSLWLIAPDGTILARDIPIEEAEARIESLLIQAEGTKAAR